MPQLFMIFKMEYDLAAGSSDDEYLKNLENGILETAASYAASSARTPREAAYRYFCDLSFKTGSTYLSERELVNNKLARRYGIDYYGLEEELASLASEGKLALTDLYGGRRYYLPHMFECEKNIAERLALIKAFPRKRRLPYEAALEKFGQTGGLILSKGQRAAAESIFSEKISVITGGPGTGKTRLIEAVCCVLSKCGAVFSLCAYTGKAAARLEELTGYKADTIHRLLHFSTEGDISQIEDTSEYTGLDEDNPLKCEYLIVDEMSMVDTDLFSALLSAVPPYAVLVLVGDDRQLSSIRPGRVFADIRDCGCFTVTELTEVFRQSSGSGIIEAGNAVKAGKLPESRGDFTFAECAGRAQALEYLLKYVSDGSAGRTQVISAYKTKRIDTGADNLNFLLREIFNPPAANTSYVSNWRMNDRVIVNANDYKLMCVKNGRDCPGVFNGETGTVCEIDGEKGLSVEMDNGRIAYFPADKAGKLSLSYALTIHKSQGSEYDDTAVLIDPYSDFITANMVYTAVTRAKSRAVLICARGTMQKVYANRQIRTSGLKDMIKDEIF